MVGFLGGGGVVQPADGRGTLPDGASGGCFGRLAVCSVVHYLPGMDQIISAAEANRRFSTLLREARDGHSFIVTARGKPVARIVPCGSGDTAREIAQVALFARLEAQPATDVGRWSRDELYER